MSKVFSVVELSGEDLSILDFFMSGNPSEDEIEVTEEFMELVESGQTQITTIVTSYMYGEGETEPATDDEVEFFSRNFEELNRKDEIDLFSSSRYNFAVEVLNEDEIEDEFEL